MGRLISEIFKEWEKECEDRFNTLKANEEELNRIFIDIYGLQDELTPDVDDKDVTVRKADKLREIKSLISYAVGCMFGRYSLEKEGLIYAGGDFKERFKELGLDLNALKFKVDEDNVIPITEKEYLTDDILMRFIDFLKVCYGEDTLTENINFIAETLAEDIGRSDGDLPKDIIKKYFIKGFYKDHLKVYQKRPIYWMFDSGKNNAFKCLIYMHRYDKSLLANIRMNYVHKIQNAYESDKKDLERKIDEESNVSIKKKLNKEHTMLIGKIEELRVFEEKIAHLANQNIEIDLDDGVNVNYQKFIDVLAKKD